MVATRNAASEVVWRAGKGLRPEAAGDTNAPRLTAGQAENPASRRRHLVKGKQTCRIGLQSSGHCHACHARFADYQITKQTKLIKMRLLVGLDRDLFKYHFDF